MASWIGGSDSQRFFQYIRPAARRAIKEGWHDLSRAHVLNEVRKLGDRPTEVGIEQKRFDRRLEALRDQFRGIARQERRDRWIAGVGPMPADVAEEYRAAGQTPPRYMADSKA